MSRTGGIFLTVLIIRSSLPLDRLMDHGPFIQSFSAPILMSLNSLLLLLHHVRQSLQRPIVVLMQLDFGL